jgi:hypothetical protein
MRGHAPHDQGATATVYRAPSETAGRSYPSDAAITAKCGKPASSSAVSARTSARRSRSSAYAARSASTASSFIQQKPLSVLQGFIPPMNWRTQMIVHYRRGGAGIASLR